MINVAVAGASGRMGSRICKAIIAAPDIYLAGAFETPDHTGVGQDLCKIIDSAPSGRYLQPGLKEVIESTSENIDVIVDFTNPDATMSILKQAVKYKTALVIGTTGLNSDQRAQIVEATNVIPIVFSPNMSLGVNLMFELVEKAASALGMDYDVEIVELHNRYKKDAPSGTAQRLGELIAFARGQTAQDIKMGNGIRESNEIFLHSLRMSDLAGEHTVYFSGHDEMLTLAHRAYSRNPFVNGTLVGIRFVKDRKPGLYTMRQIIEAAFAKISK